MRSVGQGAMLLCVIAAAAGCSGRDSESASQRFVPLAPSLSVSQNGQRVTGNATVLLPSFGDALERYSVSAIRHADGGVSGELEETSEQEGGQRIHARVYCFTVTGNSARLAARLDQTNVPFGPAGSYVVWSVIDNGQGAKSAPDQTTDIFFGATQAHADFHCSVGFNLAPYFSSLRGNLQVE